jgi:hypothetical protein
MESMAQVEGKESVDLTLTNKEIVDKYSSKVTKPKVAVRKIAEVGRMTTENGVGGYEMVDGLSTKILASEVLRKIKKMNPNFEVGRNFDIKKINGEEAAAYIAYYQDINGLKVDGILGPETYGVAAKENKLRVANVLRKAKESQMAGVDIEELDSQITKEMEEYGIVKPKEVARTLSIGDIPKAKLSEYAENYKADLPKLKQLSPAKLKAEIKKLENRRRTALAKASLKNMKSNLELKVEGAIPEASKKASAELAVVNNLLEMSKKYEKELDDGFVSLVDVAIGLGYDVPENLNGVE